jgi:hypothetical protein
MSTETVLLESYISHLSLSLDITIDFRVNYSVQLKLSLVLFNVFVDSFVYMTRNSSVYSTRYESKKK